MVKQVSIEEVTLDLQRVNDLLGRAPSFEEMRNLGVVSPSTCLKKLGPTWEDVKRSLGWKPRWESFSADLVSITDAAWICGIIDGEGCFRIQAPSPNGGNGLSKSYSPLFCMSLRDDDKPLLEKFVNIIGCSDDIRIDHYNYKNNKGNPAYKIAIRDASRLYYHLLPVINLYGLFSKKRFEFHWFSLAINIIMNKKFDGRLNFGYTNYERKTLESCKSALHELKQYQADPTIIAEKYGFVNIYEKT